MQFWLFKKMQDAFLIFKKRTTPSKKHKTWTLALLSSCNAVMNSYFIEISFPIKIVLILSILVQILQMIFFFFSKYCIKLLYKMEMQICGSILKVNLKIFLHFHTSVVGKVKDATFLPIGRFPHFVFPWAED